MKTICINCPMGCELNVEKIDGQIVVTGNECNRGEIYGKAELELPLRMLTTLVKTSSGIFSVKLSKPIPKALILKAKKEISMLKLTNPNQGEIVLKNVCNSGADVIVTGKGEKQ